jgi:hypothetical protein
MFFVFASSLTFTFFPRYTCRFISQRFEFSFTDAQVLRFHVPINISVSRDEMDGIQQARFVVPSNLNHTSKLVCHKCLPADVFSLSTRLPALKWIEAKFGGTHPLDLSPLPAHINKLHAKTKSQHISLPHQLGVVELSVGAKHECASLAMPVAPKSLRVLKLENTSITCTDFGSITHIDFGNTATKLPTSALLPATLKELRLGTRFCGLADNLPACLEVLHIGTGTSGGAFNSPLDHLPTNLRDLAVAGIFNQPIDHLPTSLTSLDLTRSDFDWPVDHLPACLTSLSLGSPFGHPIAHLPGKVKHLEIPWVRSSEISYDFSDCRELEDVTVVGDARGTLAEITIPNSVSKIMVHSKSYPHFRYSNVAEPTNLTTLEIKGREVVIGERASRTQELLSDIENYDHPVLTTVNFPNWFDAPVDNLPASLRCLALGTSFNRHVDHLPPDLTVLRFGSTCSDFDKPLDNLPTDLQSIAFTGPSVFDQPLDHLPESLRSLVLYEPSPTEASAVASTQYVSTSYAKNTRRLGGSTKMKTRFNRDLCHLPAGLKVLQVGDCFARALTYLPAALEIITLYCHKHVKVTAPSCHTRICRQYL